MNKFVFIYGFLGVALLSSAAVCWTFLFSAPSLLAAVFLLLGGAFLAYFSFGFFAIAVLYALPAERQPALRLGKDVRTGDLPVTTLVVFGGYLFSAFAWWWCRHSRLVRWLDAKRRDRRELENVHDQIIPRVHLGRRCSFEELPRGATMVVDLTAEFFAIPGVPERLGYACLPVLDTMAPDVHRFDRVLADVVEHYQTGQDATVYVHCANGHGRSASFVAALLIRLGHATGVADAQTFLQRYRPTVKLHAHQRDFLDQWIAQQQR